MESALMDILNNPVFIALIRMQLVNVLLDGAVMGLFEFGCDVLEWQLFNQGVDAQHIPHPATERQDAGHRGAGKEDQDDRTHVGQGRVGPAKGQGADTEQPHAEDADQAVQKDRRYGLGLLVVGVPGGVVGLDDVAAGQADEERVVEEADVG